MVRSSTGTESRFAPEEPRAGKKEVAAGLAFLLFYIYIYAAGCLIEPYFYPIFTKPAKMLCENEFFHPKMAKKRLPQFEGQLSTHELLLQFSTLFLPPFLGGKQGFLPCSCSRAAPKHGGHAVFFVFLARNAGGIAFPAQNCCQTRAANGLQIFCCIVFVSFVCFRASPLEKKLAESRREGTEKQHKKEEEPEEE